MLARLGLAPEYRTTFRPDTATLRIFLEDGTADVDLTTGHPAALTAPPAWPATRPAARAPPSP
ncbi:MAG TPA: hypothetical protein VF902_02935, partial [Coriobacteriia bacterium]